MADLRLLKRLGELLAGMSVPVTVSECPDHGQEAVNEPVRDGRSLVLRLSEAGLQLSCAADQAGGRQLLLMAAALAQGIKPDDTAGRSAADAYRGAMLGEYPSPELLSLGRQLQLPMELQRCLLTFHAADGGEERVFSLLESLIPLEDKDAFVQIDPCTAVLIKDLRGFETSDDVYQFGLALWDTLIVDTARKLNVGISTRFTDLTQLRSRYGETLQAIEVGSRFQREENVFAFDRLSLERFLLESNPATCRRYYERLFSPQNEALFNEEMMYTIEMFFRQDLNMSQTARQLYIHRNTLVYRLDKVQKATGFNLRSFKDAVTFKILMELKHCGSRMEE